MELYEYLSKQGSCINYRQTIAQFRVGDSIHRKDKNGTYIIKGFDDRGYVAITCKKWQIELERLQRASDVVMIRMENIKCHVGRNRKLI